MVMIRESWFTGNTSILKIGLVIVIFFCYIFQFEEEEIEDDVPVERRKKIFSKECKIYSIK